jgi:uncharacterized membrane protein YbhN (UPF0104 family)
MGKWIRSILALGIFGALAYYVAVHWRDIRYLWNLGPDDAAAAFAICFFLSAVHGRVSQLVVKVLGVRCRLWSMIMLEHAAQLLNYAPMKFGTLFRAHYLKSHYGLGYLGFVACFAYITFLMVACACVLGLAAFGYGFGFGAYENRILGGVLAVSAMASVILLVFPMREPSGEGRLSRWMRVFLSGRVKLGLAKKELAISAGLLVVSFLLGALRIGIIYRSLGADVDFAGYFVLSSLSYVAMLAGFTPGSLGIREVVLSLGAVVLGIPFELGALAALIDRAILMAYTFVVGGLCTFNLWCKSPGDFEQTEAANEAV